MFKFYSSSQIRAIMHKESVIDQFLYNDQVLLGCLHVDASWGVLFEATHVHQGSPKWQQGSMCMILDTRDNPPLKATQISVYIREKLSL